MDGFVSEVLPNIVDLLIQFFDAVIGFAQRGTGRRQFMIGRFKGRLQFLAVIVAVLLNIAERFRGFTQIAERNFPRIGGALLGFQIALQIHNQAQIGMKNERGFPAWRDNRKKDRMPAACAPAVFAFSFMRFPQRPRASVLDRNPCRASAS